MSISLLHANRNLYAHVVRESHHRQKPLNPPNEPPKCPPKISPKCERICHPFMLEPPPKPPLLPMPACPKLIVTLTFLWIAQHFVGFSSFFEVFFRHFITGILSDEIQSLSYDTLFLFLQPSGLRYAKHFIIISFSMLVCFIDLQLL